MVKRAEKGTDKPPKDDIPLGEPEKEAPPQEEKKPEAPPPEMPNINAAIDEAEAEDDVLFMERYKDLTLDDLVSKGYVRHNVVICDGFEVMIRTLKKKEELDIKKRIGEYDGVHVYILDETNSNTLCYCIDEINGEPLPEVFVDRREVVDNLSDVIAVDIIDEFRNLNKALVILLKGSSKNSLARRLFGPGQI